MKRFAAFFLAFVLLLCMVPVCAFAEEVKTTPMYRLYNPNSGEHFYTGSTEERDNLASLGWNYEGIAWNAPVTGGEPVYRLYNPNSSDHHYTMSAVERDMLVEIGWQYEGVAWNSVSATDPAAVPLYRLYNPNADCGSHHYTGSAEERDHLVAVGWIFEGIGWFGMGDHAHDYALSVVAVTCTTDGYVEYTCTVCGDSYLSETIPALGHVWKDATCTEAKKCLICGAAEGAALGHDYVDGRCVNCSEKDPDAAADSFSPISGFWWLQGVTDDKEELDVVDVTFVNGSFFLYVSYYSLIPQEHLQSALEYGYADTEEGRFFYSDIREMDGNYYAWLGSGSGTEGSYTEENNTVVLTMENWEDDAEEAAAVSTLTLERTGEDTCQFKSVEGYVVDEIVTQCIKNGNIFQKMVISEE